MRVALLTESGHPNAFGGRTAWLGRVVRGMPGHEFAVYSLACAEPPGTAPPKAGRRRGYQACYRLLLQALTDRRLGPSALAQRFAEGLYGLAGLAREDGALSAFLRTESALRSLEAALRAPAARAALDEPRVHELFAVTDLLGEALRPLSAPWYPARAGSGLAGVDLCHAASGGPVALPGLVAKRFFGTPLLVTEYGVRLREQYLAGRKSPHGTRVRAVMCAFHRLLAGEIYRQAALITPGNGHNRRWQERCGADPDRIRTVYPGIEAPRPAPCAAEPCAAEPGEPALVWVGPMEPAKDLIGLLHAFAEVHARMPETRLRIVGTVRRGWHEPYVAHLRALAAQLFPYEAKDTRSEGESPVTFEGIGTPEAPAPADAYAAGSVAVLSSVVEGFPHMLVEAMLCARATVSTDVGGVREVIGGTGLVVPPRNPRALAGGCLALLRDQPRRDRLGAAAQARAQELFTVERCVETFRGIYFDLVSHCPVRLAQAGPEGRPRPFARPAEAHVPGRWASGADWIPGRPVPPRAAEVGAAARVPSWARGGARRQAGAGLARGAAR